MAPGVKCADLINIMHLKKVEVQINKICSYKNDRIFKCADLKNQGGEAQNEKNPDGARC